MPMGTEDGACWSVSSTPGWNAAYTDFTLRGCVYSQRANTQTDLQTGVAMPAIVEQVLMLVYCIFMAGWGVLLIKAF